MLWWVCFVVDGRFAGAVIAEADTPKKALDGCNDRGINPGGDDIAYAKVPAEMAHLPRWKLLSWRDLEALGIQPRWDPKRTEPSP
jgi:hypothetical protein